MRLCILDNDVLEPALATTYTGYGAMFVRLLRDAGANWEMDIFNTVRGQYPESFDAYDAVLLTGSRADSFSSEDWVVILRDKVQALLQVKKKLVGVCFGHQLIALCLGAKVGRAPQGWGVGRMIYQWHVPDFVEAQGRTGIALLASHQDQVFELPPGASLLASNAFCPVAAFAVEEHVLCVQPHPEFVEDYSACLLNKRRDQLGEELFTRAQQSLSEGHEGRDIARMMVGFVERAQVGVKSA